MLFDKNLVRDTLNIWGNFIGEFSLPEWEALPTLPLYMDQVIYLLNEYLNYLPSENQEERMITPAMVNNYVKLKMIPAPVKKRYGRLHLAYLIQVCILKQSMNSMEIKKLLPIETAEETMQEMYNSFVRLFGKTKAEYISQVQKAAEPVLQNSELPVTYLIFQTALTANFAKLMTEQLIALQPEKTAPAEEENKK